MATVARSPLVGRQPAAGWSTVALLAQAAVTSTLVLTTLLSKDALPASRGITRDQPNPRSYAIPIANRTWAPPSLVLTTLLSKDAMTAGRGGPRDQPVPDGYRYPISLRTWTQDTLVLNTLLGKDAFFGGPGAGPDYDWPNPQIKTSIANRTHAGALVTTTLKSQDGIYGAAGQVPDYDWPNPRGYAHPVSLRTWTQSLVTSTLANADRFYGVAGSPLEDWPNPRGYPYPISLRTWTAPLAVNLRGQDAFFGLAGAPTFDWPTPARPAVPIDVRTWVQGPVPSVAATPAPFSQADWPNPRGGDVPTANRTFAQAMPLALVGQDAFFGTVGAPLLDWPNPRGPIYPVALRTHLHATSPALVAGSQAPAYDWPNPSTGRPFPVALRTHAQSLVTTALAGQDAFFGVAGAPNRDHPNPRGYPYPTSLRTWSQSLVLTTLAGADTRTAGVSEWPNPQRPVRPIALLTWLQAPAVPPTPTAAPFAPIDWPNPRPVDAARVARSGSQAPNLALNADARPTTAAAPTANPIGPTFSQARHGWLQSMPIALLAAAPVPAVDFPNPARASWTAAQTATAGTPVPLLVQLATPPPPMSWPNPARPTWAQAASTGTPLPLLASAAIAPAVAWPNPVRAAVAPTLHACCGMPAPLVGQDDLGRGPGCAPLVEFPNPQEPRRTIDLRVWNVRTAIAQIQALQATDTIDVAGEYLHDLSTRGEWIDRLDSSGEYLPALDAAGTFGVNVMAIKATLGGAGKMFVGEDKTLRLTGVVDANGALIDVSGWTIQFVGGPISKSATVTGVFNADPTLNTQFPYVTLTAAEAAVLYATTYAYAWKRIDAGFNVVLAYGNWPVQQTTQ